MIISTAAKSLCKRCNTDIKEKLACEIYELITAFGLPVSFKMLSCSVGKKWKPSLFNKIDTRMLLMFLNSNFK